ncbi:MAG TPA: hypothetical protein VFQ91_11330 [Bryobacteraceae bacterium]|nr:hypothetical protein [Bryobacteraceae bacterium]
MSRLVYCNCSFARVLPPDVKAQVLDGLAASGRAFDAVPDLCEMSARKDPFLVQIAQGPVTIAACYPRAVRWLFSAASAPLDAEQATILNMRADSAQSVLDAMGKSD